MNDAQQRIEVARAMIEHTKAFTTPISRVIEDNYGELEGSGSYVLRRGKRHLITNAHVAARRLTHSIAHQFQGSDNVYRLLQNCPAWEAPQDIALCEITDEVWDHVRHCAEAIPEARFATKHSPVDEEFLFLVGYPGERSKFFFNTLHSAAMPYLSQQTAVPPNEGNPQYHFAIIYNTAQSAPIESGGRSLSVPPGLSGSLVWNSRFKEAIMSGGTWSPNMAQVTGIVWGWPSAERLLLATKVEYFQLDELLDLFEQHQNRAK